jgi:acetyl-CoA carboxylase carboxyltransferase component
MADKNPQDWSAEIDELNQRRTIAENLGGSEAVAKQHARGKLTARERITILLDQKSFREMGMLAGHVSYNDQNEREAALPSTSIIGCGTVDTRRSVVAADDFTIRGGSSEAVVSEKWIYADRYAEKYRLPIVRLIDSAGGSVKLVEKLGHTKLPGYSLWPLTSLLGTVPVVGIAMGACAGLGALRVAASHLSIMVRPTAQIFAGGPPVVKRAFGIDITKEELGGFDEVHAKSGVAQMAAESDEHALQLARTFLSYLPQNVWQMPPRTKCTDQPARADAELDRIIPKNPRQIFNPRKILKLVFDHDSVFELGKNYGGSLITALARLDGYPVGVMINNPMVAGGALTRVAARKMERFTDFCDTFHLPMVNLVDQAGVMTGPEAEKDGTLLAAANALHAIEQVTIPWVAIVIRRCMGLGGAMIGPWNGPEGTSLPHRFAWPSARWGSIPVEGGVAAAYRREIEAAENPQELADEIEARYQAIASPFRTAERFGIIDIIAPHETRTLLCDWVKDAYALESLNPGPKRRMMR